MDHTEKVAENASDISAPSSAASNTTHMNRRRKGNRRSEQIFAAFLLKEYL
jgi:hypothetical protein